MRFTQWVPIGEQRIPCPGGHRTRLPRSLAERSTSWLCTYHKSVHPFAVPCGELLALVADPCRGRKLVASVSAPELTRIAAEQMAGQVLIRYLLASEDAA